MKLYMMTTQDRYELPLAVADSVVELSEITGVRAKSIHEALSHRRINDKRKRKRLDKIHPKWHKVEIGEEDEND